MTKHFCDRCERECGGVWTVYVEHDDRPEPISTNHLCQSCLSALRNWISPATHHFGYEGVAGGTQGSAGPRTGA